MDHLSLSAHAVDYYCAYEFRLNLKEPLLALDFQSSPNRLPLRKFLPPRDDAKDNKARVPSILNRHDPY